MVIINTGRLASNVFSANVNLSKSVERLSTNKRLRTDYPSSIVRSENLRSDLNGTNVVVNGLQEVREYFTVAADLTDQVLENVQELRELAVTASDPNVTDAERAIMAATEWATVNTAITNLANTTAVNGTTIGDGSWFTAAGKAIRVGDRATDTFTVTTQSGNAIDLTSNTLGINGYSISSQTNASNAITGLDTIIATVTSYSSTLNTAVNSIDHFTSLRQTQASNLDAAISVIEDIDVASEMANYTKLSVIQQASISMLAQGNLASQNMLALFA